MRLLVITTGLNAGGAERALFNLIQNGLREECTLHVVSLRDSSHYGKLLRSQEVDVTCLGLQNPLYFPIAMVRLFLLINKFKPELIQGWMYHGNMVALLASAFVFYKVNVIWGIRQSLYDIKKEKVLTRFTIKINALFSFLADHIIYNSQVAMVQHQSIGFDSKGSLYVPNGFDMAVWKPKKKIKEDLRLRLNIAPTSFVIGYIGRFHDQKNIPMIFDALEAHLKSNPDLVFLIIGEGTTRNNPLLSSSYNKLPPNQVISLGIRHDVDDVIQCLDLLCLSSSWGEGFPNVLGEAMSVGVPCITTNVGDSAIVVEGVGWVVDPDDVEAFKLSIGLALQESKDVFKKRSLASIKRIYDNYQIQSVVNKYIEIYSSLR